MKNEFGRKEVSSRDSHNKLVKDEIELYFFCYIDKKQI